jgi:hypothetical protein
MPSDVTNIVGEVIELMSFSIFQKGIEFVTYMEPCTEVMCDGNRLKQASLMKRIEVSSLIAVIDSTQFGDKCTQVYQQRIYRA